MIGQEKYYQLAQEASLQIGKHPGLITIQSLALKSKKILDVGCGEGTRLNLFTGKIKIGTGVDVSSFAINKAGKQYPHHKFILVKGEKLPFSSNSFDLVYSTFVLEHTQDQELFIKEMFRVTKKDGSIAILCPNYGSPNRRSPVSVEKPLKKLLLGFLQDLFPTRNSSLSFTKVTPQKKFKNPDDDTTCEPYLLKLQRYVSHFSNIKIGKSSSLWEIDDHANSIHQRLFKFLGILNIFPFKHWGPQLFIVLRKI